MKWTVWAVVDPHGNIIADSSFKTEAKAWRVALGWPSGEEIENAKKRGYKSMQVNIVPA